MTGSILGLDIGDRRIGVALSDELQIVASPADVIVRNGNEIDQITKITQVNDVVLIVAGLPTNMSGKEGHQAELARNFAEDVAIAANVPLEYWDERLSTALAERMMIESGSRRARRKSRIDAVAASLILQGYLDSVRSRT